LNNQEYAKEYSTKNAEIRILCEFQRFDFFVDISQKWLAKPL